MNDTQQALANLRAKLANLEGLRDVLGDDAVEKAKAEIEARIQNLVDTGGGAAIAGDVTVKGGNLIGRDLNLRLLWVFRWSTSHAP